VDAGRSSTLIMPCATRARPRSRRPAHRWMPSEPYTTCSVFDVIWEQWQATLEPLRGKLNDALKKEWQEWEIPREADEAWLESAKKLHAEWWQARIAPGAALFTSGGAVIEPAAPRVTKN
jgi:hypothetical protein